MEELGSEEIKVISEVEICKSVSKLGFINASLDYTLLDIERYSNINIYRLVEEIFTAV